MMNNKYLSLGVCNLTAMGVAAGLSVTAVPSTAAAQAAIAEVIVTARKREENLQEVPVAISVFSGDAMKEAGISSTRDLFENTPGLNFETGFDANASTPAIRGVVSNEIATYRQKVTTFLDGMPILGQQGTVPFMAIQQVEVLRGPQSAAFGRSTFGGAINYTTRDPRDMLEAEFSAEGGSDNLLNLGGLVAGPLVDGLLGGLLAVSSERRDGESSWRTVAEGIALGGEKNQSAMAKLVLTPGSSTHIEFRWKWQDVDNDPTPRVFLNLNDANRKIHPDAPASVTVCGTGVPRPSCAYQGDIESLANPVFNQNFGAIGIADPFVRNKRDRYELEVTQDLRNGLSLQAMGFVSDEYYERANDMDLNNNLAGFERDPTNIDETYAELRLTSPGNKRFRYGVGISWYDYDFGTNIFRSQAALLAGLPTVQIQESATNTGYFFSTAFDLTEQWTASIEGRYQSDEVSGTAKQVDGSYSGLTRTTKKFLPRVAVTYTPTPATTFYAQVAKGNNPAGVNTGSLDNRVIAASNAYPQQFNVNQTAFYDEEKVTSFEVGMKGTVNNRASYAVNVYQLDWTGYTQPFNLNFEPSNFIDASPDDGIGDVGSQYAGLSFTPGRSFLQAGNVTGYGAEFEGNYLATDNFSIGAALSYTDITYDDGACSTAPNSNFGVIANASTATGLACTSVAGNELPLQPKVTAAINLGYKLPLANGMEWFTRWTTNYNSSQYANEMNLAKLGAYSISGIRTGLSRNAWRVEGYATNLFDDDTPLAPSYFGDGRLAGPPPFTQNIVYTVRRGRAYGLRFSYKM